jgi:hypothetical protein
MRTASIRRGVPTLANAGRVTSGLLHRARGPQRGLTSFDRKQASRLGRLGRAGPAASLNCVCRASPRPPRRARYAGCREERGWRAGPRNEAGARRNCMRDRRGAESAQPRTPRIATAVPSRVHAAKAASGRDRGSAALRPSARPLQRNHGRAYFGSAAMPWRRWLSPDVRSARTQSPTPATATKRDSAETCAFTDWDRALCDALVLDALAACRRTRSSGMPGLLMRRRRHGRRPSSGCRRLWGWPSSSCAPRR